METKICSKCGKEKPLSEFYFNKQRGNYYASCKKCKYEYTKAHRKSPDSWYAKHNTEYKRDYRARNLYGITGDEYDKILSRGCEVCGSTEKLHLDHDHSTGKVRGCLCQSCNLALGLMGDNPERLHKLANYMEKHHA